MDAFFKIIGLKPKTRWTDADDHTTYFALPSLIFGPFMAAKFLQQAMVFGSVSGVFLFGSGLLAAFLATILSLAALVYRPLRPFYVKAAPLLLCVVVAITLYMAAS